MDQDLTCWHCNADGGFMVFDFEYDTPVHPECVIRNLHERPTDSENLVIAKSILRELEVYYEKDELVNNFIKDLKHYILFCQRKVDEYD